MQRRELHLVVGFGEKTGDKIKRRFAHEISALLAAEVPDADARSAAIDSMIPGGNKRRGSAVSDSAAERNSRVPPCGKAYK
jgi:hypothetical protein